MTRHVWALLGLLLLTGCGGSVSIADYKDQTPALKLEEYFSGHTRAWGMVQDRSGKVMRRFTVDIAGRWNAASRTLVLDEKFVYDDGEKDTRIWTLTKTSDSTWSGTGTNGVVGTATGETAGNAFNMTYTFDLPYKGRTIRVLMDDWMYLQADGVLLNQTAMNKWGFDLATVTISFTRLEKPAYQAQQAAE